MEVVMTADPGERGGYVIHTQADRDGRELTVLSVGDGRYAIRKGGEMLPERWGIDEFAACARAFRRMLERPAERDGGVA